MPHSRSTPYDNKAECDPAEDEAEYYANIERMIPALHEVVEGRRGRPLAGPGSGTYTSAKRLLGMAGKSTPYEKKKRRLARTAGRPAGGLREFLLRSENSRYREKLLLHRFLADLYLLSAEHSYKFDILQGDVDEHGHDLILVTDGQTRHLQLKSKLTSSGASSWPVSTKLLLPTPGALAKTPLFPQEPAFCGLGGRVVLQELYTAGRGKLLVGYRLADVVTIAASDKKVLLRLSESAREQRIRFNLPIRVFTPPVDPRTLVWLLQLPMGFPAPDLPDYDARCLGPLAVLSPKGEGTTEYTVDARFQALRRALAVTWEQRLNAWREGRV